MKAESAIFRPTSEHATPRCVLDFFVEVFAALEDQPRPVRVEIDLSEAGDVPPLTLDLEKGEPVISQEGHNAAHGRLAGRWLAEHPVPLAIKAPSTRLLLVPTDTRRIKVRPA